MNQFKHLSADAAEPLLATDTSHWLDIRDPQSWQGGHVKGAVHIDNNNLQTFTDNTVKTDALVIYCYHGNSSQSAAAWFADQGFTEVYSLDGGFEHWRQQFPQHVVTD